METPVKGTRPAKTNSMAKWEENEATNMEKLANTAPKNTTCWERAIPSNEVNRDRNTRNMDKHVISAFVSYHGYSLIPKIDGIILFAFLFAPHVPSCPV